jgi:hypothetical protein
LLHQTANRWRFALANDQSYSDQLLAGRPHSFGGLGARPCPFGGQLAQTTTDLMDYRRLLFNLNQQAHDFGNL